MAGVSLVLFFAGLSAVAISHEFSRHESDLYNLTSNFMNEFNDFADRKLNYDFFPLSKAMEFNRISGRPDNNVTGKPDYGSMVSANLSMWRGFIEVTEMGFLFNESSFEINLDETVERNYLEELPLGWQYLLPSKYYLRLNLSGEAWVEMVDTPQKNLDLFFKIAILLRDESNFTKDQFVHVQSPNNLNDDLSYILGNRWFVDLHNPGDDFHTKTLLHLPVETVMGIEHKDFVNMKALERLLENRSAWKMADARAVVAWFSKVKNEIGWSGIAGSSEDVRKYGVMLSGARLDLLQKLTKGYNSKVVSELLKETDMNALRVQELWESLALEERVDLFPIQAQKLDVTQIFSYFDDKIDHHRNEKAFLDLELLTHTEVPWTNIMVIGEKRLPDRDPGHWRKHNVVDLGKFIVLLFPSELEKIQAAVFDDDVFPNVLSPLLSYSQRTVLYRAYKRSVASRGLHPILMVAIPSDTILMLGSNRSSLAEVTWEKDYAGLLEASAMYVPSQMQALHSLADPAVWQTQYLSSILQIQPHFLANTIPKEFRNNLKDILNAVYSSGLSEEITRNIKFLPRILLMSWLEAVLEMPGSSNDNGRWWKTNVLMDRKRSDLEDSQRSFLPSLALAGLSCHCIEKIETPDSLAVLGYYRYYIETLDVVSSIPSMARKCWAKKIRHYLLMKAKLFNVTVTDEVELLSLLTTSDVRAVGGEILLTWGGAALAGITHPQVQEEVLTTIASIRPHLFLNNGVDVDDVKYLSKTLLGVLKKRHGRVNLKVLAALHNFVPFADQEILEASREEARLYVTSVLKPICKSVCLPSRSRLLLRDFLFKAYGDPQDWTALDLVEMSDMMIVFSPTDLAKVSLTSLRRAAPQLVSGTLYTSRLHDIRGFSDTVLHHEACSSWLGGIEGLKGSEASEFREAWQNLAEFYILGSHLEVEIVDHEIERKSTVSRKKRQSPTEMPLKDIYFKFIVDMREQFENGSLDDDLKEEATKTLYDTQTLLGDYSLNVLGMEKKEGATTKEVMNIIKTERLNMTPEQTESMQKLANETQIRVIQGLARVFGYSNEEISKRFDIPINQISRLMNRQTFTETPPIRTREFNSTVEIATTTLLPITTSTTTPSPSSTSTTSAATESSVLTTTTTSVPSTTSRKPSTISTVVTTTEDVGIEPPKPSALVNLTIPVFDRYGPAANYSDDDNLRTLPKLDSIVLTCNCIKSSATAASALKAKHIRAMSDQEVFKCLDTLGMLPWPSTDREHSWGELLLSILKTSTTESESDHSFLKRDQMIQLNNLLPDIAEFNLDVLDVGRENIDGISSLGRHGLSSEVTTKLVQRYFMENNISQSNPLIATEVAALGQLLCGFSDEQWIAQITPDIFKSTLVEHLSRLNCNISTAVSNHLRNLLIDLYGPTNSWTSSDVFSIGWVAAVLTESDLSSLPVSVIEGLSPKALIHMDLSKLSSEDLRDLSPHTASFIRKSQLSSRTPESKRRAIRAAGGESIRLRSIMKGLEPVEVIDVSNDSTQEMSTSGQPVTATIELTTLILSLVLWLHFIS